ncbi:MAG: DJ-1/PfpI family protein [Lachnospiraceae bacterium]|nr:DJ-1/PfpI family protein [Lachnospiraceae bacterium]
MSKIAVFLAPGFEEIEALTVVDLCRRVGIEVVMAAVVEENGPDAKADILVTGSHGIAVKADAVLETVDFDSLDMIVLPGGMPGTKNLEACEPLMAQLDVFYKSGKNIAAICAAPSIFGHRGYLNGRSACSYPGFEGHLTDACVTENPVEVSENVITSRGLGTAIPFALAIVECFCGKERAEELAKGVVYK